ncbi:MAG: nucleoside:proton symporter [Gammaproteobacteria bacterium]|nr:nucleoside:proton symporter [Gammaproteobacteria bacterium]
MVQGLVGIAVFVLIAWIFSESRRAVSWRLVISAIALQFVLAALLLYLPGSRVVFEWLNSAVNALQDATLAGTSFVLGYVGGAAAPFTVTDPGAQFILGFRGLPLVLVISAITSVLTYWGVLPRIIHGFGLLLQRTLKLGGATGFATAANIFVGMVEAPLFVKPYLSRISHAELFILMATGMATIAGTVLVLYATILAPLIDDAIVHLLIASVISAPAAIGIAMIMVPESTTQTSAEWVPERGANSTMDAIANGTLGGLQLVLNIAAMLIVLVALVALVNATLSLLPDFAGAPLTLERMLGWIMAPLCWCMGIPWAEATTAGQLMGVKTVLNELIAYARLADLPPGALSAHSTYIMTYALCGFANFGSLGIMIGGLAAMVPSRRVEIIGLGMRSIAAGTLATSMTAAVIGILLPA